LDQETDFPFEVLLGEDESTDGTREICTEYAGRYPGIVRLFLHRRQNNIIIDGVPTGRFNFVHNLLSARGKYVAVCEGDDFWTDRHKLKKQVAFMERNPEYSLCYHAFDVTGALDRRANLSALYDKNVAPPANICDLQYYVAHKCVKTLTMLFRREAISAREVVNVLCDPPTPTSGDIPLVFLLLTKGRGRFFPDVMGVYRLHNAGITNVKRSRRDNILISTLKLYPAVPNELDKRYLKERLKYALKRNFEKFRIGTAFSILKVLIMG